MDAKVRAHRRWRPWRAVGALVVVVLVVVGAAVPAVIAYRLHPARVPVDDDPGRHGLSYEAISFASLLDGAPLSGWYLSSPKSTGRAIVVAPGIDNNRLQSGITLRLAPALLGAGFDVLAFDLRGEGESGGAPITFGAREQWDILAAVKEAKARGAERVGVLGFSLGAASAILAAARSREIDALVVDSGFFNLEEMLTREMEGRYHLPGPLVAYALLDYRLLSGTDPSEVAPGLVIGDIAPRPILLIHGTADETFPTSDSERLLVAAGGSAAQLWLVPGGRHTGSYFADPVGYERRVIDFFSEALRQDESIARRSRHTAGPDAAPS